MNLLGQGNGLLRAISEALQGPTHYLLLLSACMCLFETGVFVHERVSGERGRTADALIAIGRERIGRLDVLARVGPMLGLMGTLIPLGPGLSALGHGDLSGLAQAVTVAFDTTVVGLAVGIMAFCLARARRHLYDRLLDQLEASRPTVIDAPIRTPAGEPS